MKKLAVFLGSKIGASTIYTRVTMEIGKLLATNNLTLVCGGGSTGLMRTLIESTLTEGGAIITIVPENEKDNQLSTPFIEMQYVKDIASRKKLFSDLADAFLILPGGIGTLDELINIYCLVKTENDKRPIVILNVNGFYDDFISLLNRFVQDEFMKEKDKNLIIVEREPLIAISKILEFIEK